MSTTFLTQTDLRVRELVIQQLDWAPAIDATGIGVAIHNGIVTLSGTVRTHAESLAAERTALGVEGVRAVANDIRVRNPRERNTADIAADAARALELRCTVPRTVRLAVDRGCVSLSGEVEWPFQQLDAEDAVRHVRGVTAIANHIEVRHTEDPSGAIPAAADELC